MNKNPFKYLSQYEREYIEAILIKYIKIYNSNPSKYNITKDTDNFLSILNSYIHFTVKPQWFDSENINLISDCYDYIASVTDDIDSYSVNDKYTVLFPGDVISSDQKKELSELIKPLKNKVMRNGKSFGDIDINYIPKNKYGGIINLIQGYQKKYLTIA